MPLEVEVTGARYPVDDSVVSDVLAFAADRLPACPDGAWTLTVVLVDTDQISQLHAAYFDDPSPTDVISFPSGDDVSADEGYLGDVVICVEVANQQAAAEGHSLPREVVFLALHGLLHLCGYLDATDEERAQMLQLQSDLLEAYEQRHGTV